MIRQVRIRSRMAWRQAREFTVHYLLHADDHPHRLALGAAIGMFVTFTPTVGVQMALIVFLSWLLGANKIIGLPVAWISNPVTIVPIFWTNYELGALFLHMQSVDAQWWVALKDPPPGWVASFAFYWSKMLEIFLPLWVGSLLMATLLGMMTYVAVNRLVIWYRMRRFGQLVPPSAAKYPPQRRPLRRRRKPAPTHE